MEFMRIPDPAISCGIGLHLASGPSAQTEDASSPPVGMVRVQNTMLLMLICVFMLFFAFWLHPPFLEQATKHHRPARGA